jgi:hypothetical protein
MRATPDVFPSLASEFDLISGEEVEILPHGVLPSNFLAANSTGLICSDGSTTIQLLRISEFPTPILPI